MSLRKLGFACLLAVLILLGACDSTGAISENIASSEQVKEIQSGLRNFGYYNGVTNGIYNEETRSAVNAFQKQNGIVSSEGFDEVTAGKLGIKLDPQTDEMPFVVEDEVYLLAQVIYSQADSEPYLAKVSVGAVILNRVKNSKFPNTLNGCLNQDDTVKFDDGVIPDEESKKAAMDAYLGADPTNGALFYFETRISNEFFDSLHTLTKIGKFSFCTD